MQRHFPGDRQGVPAVSGSAQHQERIHSPGPAVARGITLDIRDVIHHLIAQPEAFGGFAHFAKPGFFALEQERHLQREAQQRSRFRLSHFFIKGQAINLLASR